MSELEYKKALSKENLQSITIEGCAFYSKSVNKQITGYNFFGNPDFNGDRGRILKSYEDTGIFVNEFISITFAETEKGVVKSFLHNCFMTNNILLSMEETFYNRQGDILYKTNHENYCLLCYDYANTNSDAILYTAIFVPLNDKAVERIKAELEKRRLEYGKKMALMSKTLVAEPEVEEQSKETTNEPNKA